MEFTLTRQQQQVFDTVEGTPNNILLCGKPGVGKSVLIRALTDEGNKFYTLAAPTGLAALNINGKTLHSIFRIPASQGIIHPEYDRYPTDQRVLDYIKYSIKHLIIDEISMVRADLFDYIDRVMRFAKGSDLPFGGAQIIAIGDFFQLPPVVTAADKVQLKDAGYESEFMFSARCFNGNFKVLMLDEVLRQKGDPEFLDLLDNARTGNVFPKQLKPINKQIGEPGDIRIKVTGTNKQAEEINQRELQRLPEPSFKFVGQKYGEWPALPAEEFLTLKVGAQIMVKKNGADRPPGLRGEFHSKVVNGSIGVVTEINDNDDNPSITIKLDDGTEAVIYRVTWERKIKDKDTNGKWTERVVASYSQMPIALAWAISIHKSQGQTFEKVHVDATRIFAPGQLYVALSRCKSIAGISLEREITTRQFWANDSVLEFFERIEA